VSFVDAADRSSGAAYELSKMSDSDAREWLRSCVWWRDLAMSTKDPSHNVHKGSFFQRSALPLTMLVDLLYYWSVDMLAQEAAHQVGVSLPTVLQTGTDLCAMSVPPIWSPTHQIGRTWKYCLRWRDNGCKTQAGKCTRTFSAATVGCWRSRSLSRQLLFGDSTRTFCCNAYTCAAATHSARLYSVDRLLARILSGCRATHIFRKTTM